MSLIFKIIYKNNEKLFVAITIPSVRSVLYRTIERLPVLSKFKMFYLEVLIL